MRFLTIPLAITAFSLAAVSPSLASEADYLASLQGNLKGTGFAKLRTNRMALLNELSGLFLRVADFSRLA